MSSMLDFGEFLTAARTGNLDTMRRGKKKDFQRVDQRGMTALLCAAHGGHLEALRLAVERGGSVHKCDLHGNSALHHAAANGHVTCVIFLTVYGANLWAMDNNFYSPLEVAIRLGQLKVAGYLETALANQLLASKKAARRRRAAAILEAHRRIDKQEDLEAGRVSKGDRGQRRFRFGRAKRKDTLVRQQNQRERANSLYGGVRYSSYSLSSHLSGQSLASRLQRDASLYDPSEIVSQSSSTSIYLSSSLIETSTLYGTGSMDNVSMVTGNTVESPFHSEASTIVSDRGKSKSGVAKQLDRKLSATKQLEQLPPQLSKSASDLSTAFEQQLDNASSLKNRIHLMNLLFPRKKKLPEQRLDVVEEETPRSTFLATKDSPRFKQDSKLPSPGDILGDRPGSAAGDVASTSSNHHVRQVRDVSDETGSSSAIRSSEARSHSIAAKPANGLADNKTFEITPNDMSIINNNTVSNSAEFDTDSIPVQSKCSRIYVKSKDQVSNGHTGHYVTSVMVSSDNSCLSPSSLDTETDHYDRPTSVLARYRASNGSAAHVLNKSNDVETVRQEINTNEDQFSLPTPVNDQLHIASVWRHKREISNGLRKPEQPNDKINFDSKGLTEFLNRCNLSEYESVFVRERIDMNSVSLLTDKDLKALGLPLGPRKRLITALAENLIYDNTSL